MASGCGDLNIDRQIIRKLLNHAEQDITGEVYELSDRWPQKVAAMQAWSDELTRLISGQPLPEKVRRLERAR